VFNSITWCPASEGLTTIIECVGNCNLQEDNAQHDFQFNNNRYLITGQIKYEEVLNDYLVTVRDKFVIVQQYYQFFHELIAGRERE